VITNLKMMGFLALTMVLCLTSVGCSFNTQDAVILGLDAVEAAAGVAVAAGPDPAAAAVLQIIVSAVPTCIQIYQSSEPLAQKASDITATRPFSRRRSALCGRYWRRCRGCRHPSSLLARAPVSQHGKAGSSHTREGLSRCGRRR
jgi:hypothetical protein